MIPVANGYVPVIITEWPGPVMVKAWRWWHSLKVAPSRAQRLKKASIAKIGRETGPDIRMLIDQR